MNNVDGEVKRGRENFFKRVPGVYDGGQHEQVRHNWGEVTPSSGVLRCF